MSPFVSDITRTGGKVSLYPVHAWQRICSPGHPPSRPPGSRRGEAPCRACPLRSLPRRAGSVWSASTPALLPLGLVVAVIGPPAEDPLVRALAPLGQRAPNPVADVGTRLVLPVR